MKASYFLIPMVTSATALLLWQVGNDVATWLATAPFVHLVAWK
jgi:hypothetical protein